MGFRIGWWATAAELAAPVQQGFAAPVANDVEFLLSSTPEALGTLVRPSVFKTDATGSKSSSGGFDSHALPLLL